MKGRGNMATTTGTNSAAKAQNPMVSGRSALSPLAILCMLGSVGWDAFASYILSVYPGLGPEVRLLIYTPTGALFLWSIQHGFSVGPAYIMFGLLVAFTNGAAGAILLNQVPANFPLAVLGTALGVSAVSLGSKLRTGDESEPNALWPGVVVIAGLVTWFAFSLEKGFIVTALVAAVATALWDIAATPVSQWLEVSLKAKRFVSKLVIRLGSFALTSFMYSRVLELNGGMLESAIMVGATSAMLAPIMEALIYGERGEKRSFNIPLFLFVVICAGAAIWLVHLGFK